MRHRPLRNPPSGRDCCASSVAAPLPCPLGSAEMEGFHPSKPPHERGFAPLSKPAGQRFVICHLSHYFSDVVAKNNGLPNFEGLSLPARLCRDGGVSPPPQTPPLFARLDIGIGYRIPMGEVVVPRPWESSQSATHSQTWTRKGSMEQSVHRPLIKSGLVG